MPHDTQVNRQDTPVTANPLSFREWRWKILCSEHTAKRVREKGTTEEKRVHQKFQWRVKLEAFEDFGMVLEITEFWTLTLSIISVYMQMFI